LLRSCQRVEGGVRTDESVHIFTAGNIHNLRWKISWEIIGI